jgi:hypothetical protein
MEGRCYCPEVISFYKKPGYFNPHSGVQVPATAYISAPHAEHINKGECPHFKYRPTIGKDGFGRWLYHSIFGALTPKLSQEEIDALPTESELLQAMWRAASGFGLKKL